MCVARAGACTHILPLIEPDTSLVMCEYKLSRKEKLFFKCTLCCVHSATSIT